MRQKTLVEIHEVATGQTAWLVGAPPTSLCSLHAAAAENSSCSTSAHTAAAAETETAAAAAACLAGAETSLLHSLPAHSPVACGIREDTRISASAGIRRKAPADFSSIFVCLIFFVVILCCQGKRKSEQVSSQ